jgi:hypothetical protein
MAEGNGEATDFFRAKLPLLWGLPYKNRALPCGNLLFFGGDYMIIALYALALAMIVGGLFAAILGWDIVLVERGWTMVISGVVGASSGALLLGITLIVSKLARIQEELGRVQLALEDEIETVVIPTPAEQARGRIVEDVASAAAGLVAGGFFGSRRAASDTPAAATDDQPSLDVAHEPAEETRLEDEEEEVPFELRSATAEDRVEAGLEQEPEDVSEGKVPDFLFAERYSETVITETVFPERETPSFAGTSVPETREDEPLTASEPDLNHEDVFETEPPEEADEAEALGEAEIPGRNGTPPTVIGTYNSGDNKYVMYSDGSIEAETPQGFFRFGSLDELKEFIAAGGEGSPSASI